QKEIEMRPLNSRLKERGGGGPAHLEAANGGGEAFFYSLAPDLRAPLRAIEGFSRSFSYKNPPRAEETGVEHRQTARPAGKTIGTAHRRPAQSVAPDAQRNASQVGRFERARRGGCRGTSTARAAATGTVRHCPGSRRGRRCPLAAVCPGQPPGQRLEVHRRT